MSKCIIEGCEKSGGLYVTHEGFKTGPYCSQHRFELQCHIDKRKRQMITSEWNTWVSEFQFEITQKED